MIYEINSMAMFDLFRNRGCRIPGRRSRSIVWPRHPANIPGIPFGPYAERVRDGINAAASACDISEKDGIDWLESQTRLKNLREIVIPRDKIFQGEI